MRSDLGLHAADVLKRIGFIRDPTECPGVLRSLSHLNFCAPNLYMLRNVAERHSGTAPQPGSQMKITLANAEAALDEVQRDTDKLHSQELRKAIADYIETQREALKALRKKLH
ncbi:hypothetical protein ABIF64_003423 [Bradyrhizobium japonicum]|uniref:Ribbon-helix-helix protein CopG domain-containing protein n=4 Tax=Bradyrhizobium TaxID=374 RepID=A0ABV2S7M6_BRAJP